MSVVLPGTYSVQNCACFMSAARTHFLSGINCRQSSLSWPGFLRCKHLNPVICFPWIVTHKAVYSVNTSSTKCTSWYNTCDMHKLLHVSAPMCHLQVVITTKVYNKVHLLNNTGRSIMYSGITKIYYRETVGHLFTKPVQIEGTTQKNFFPVSCFSSSSHFFR